MYCMTLKGQYKSLYYVSNNNVIMACNRRTSHVAVIHRGIVGIESTIVITRSSLNPCQAVFIYFTCPLKPSIRISRKSNQIRDVAGLGCLCCIVFKYFLSRVTGVYTLPFTCSNCFILPVTCVSDVYRLLVTCFSFVYILPVACFHFVDRLPVTCVSCVCRISITRFGCLYTSCHVCCMCLHTSCHVFQVFIDFLSHALCMSSDTLPKRHADRQPIVYKDGKDGYKSGRRSQRAKMPDMKYNKFQMLDLSESPPLVASHMSPSPPPPGWMTPPPAATAATVTPRNGVTLERGDNRENGSTDTPTPTHGGYRPTPVERDVRDIRRYLNAMLMYIKDKEDLNRIAVEWRMVALVLDRLFFFMYVTVIIVSLVTIFPKTY